ncbi:MAG: hypothetical protein JXP73_04360 [Deltaproteobacteria bacterium]|jgi:hypothetical protein|nr:hypothetical protein [Deltaproteobacteria bacterium]
MPSPPPDRKRKAGAKPSPPRAAHRPAPAAKPPQVAFPKKNQPPNAAAFAARLPLALGKRFEMARSFLLRQKDVKEDVYFYGPKTGWALRYLRAEQPLCALLLHDDAPVGIVSLSAVASAAVDWKALSPIGQTARKRAHGSPLLLWLDVPLAGAGAADFKAILRAKLATLGTPATTGS